LLVTIGPIIRRDEAKLLTIDKVVADECRHLFAMNTARHESLNHSWNLYSSCHWAKDWRV